MGNNHTSSYEADPSDDEDHEIPELGPMPNDLSTNWTVKGKSSATTRVGIKKYDMACCNWDSGWEVGYIIQVPKQPLTDDSLFYAKFPGNRNFWPVYLLDSQYGV